MKYSIILLLFLAACSDPIPPNALKCEKYIETTGAVGRDIGFGTVEWFNEAGLKIYVCVKNSKEISFEDAMESLYGKESE